MNDLLLVLAAMLIVCGAYYECSGEPRPGRWVTITDQLATDEPCPDDRTWSMADSDSTSITATCTYYDPNPSADDDPFR